MADTFDKHYSNALAYEDSLVHPQSLRAFIYAIAHAAVEHHEDPTNGLNVYSFASNLSSRLIALGYTIHNPRITSKQHSTPSDTDTDTVSIIGPNDLAYARGHADGYTLALQHLGIDGTQ